MSLTYQDDLLSVGASPFRSYYPVERTSDSALLFRVVLAVVSAISAISAGCLTAAFVSWTNQYRAIIDQAAETATTARYPWGFLAAGNFEAIALVLVTSLALLAGVLAVAGNSVRTARPRTIVFGVAAALFAAVVVPTAVLDGFLAAFPVIAATTTAVLARRPSTVTRSR
ncbi:MAG TPA: hypothetical protein VF444_08960 [Pseudonocardiaceae bacterium]